jgi:hypothetical protein
VPTTIFFAPDGTERHRMVGYIGPEDFAKMLDETRATSASVVGSTEINRPATNGSA